MMYLSDRVAYIRNLAIFQSPAAYATIKDYVDESKDNGVDIMELVINPYIYNLHALDLSLLIPYIQVLNGLISFFRMEYDELIYDIANHFQNPNQIINIANSENAFQYIFFQINNEFNQIFSMYITDENIFYHMNTDFNIHLSTSLYNSFIRNMSMYMSRFGDMKTIKNYIYQKSIMNGMSFHNSIQEIFEPLILPFY